MEAAERLPSRLQVEVVGRQQGRLEGRRDARLRVAVDGPVELAVGLDQRIEGRVLELALERVELRRRIQQIRRQGRHRHELGPASFYNIELLDKLVGHGGVQGVVLDIRTVPAVLQFPGRDLGVVQPVVLVLLAQAAGAVAIRILPGLRADVRHAVRPPLGFRRVVGVHEPRLDAVRREVRVIVALALDDLVELGVGAQRVVLARRVAAGHQVSVPRVRPFHAPDLPGLVFQAPPLQINIMIVIIVLLVDAPVIRQPEVIHPFTGRVLLLRHLPDGLHLRARQ